MTMLQIKQLTLTDHISTDRQQHILGGGAGPHNSPSTGKYKDRKTSEELWSGYAGGTYDIGAGENINFLYNGSTVGAISETGSSLRIKNPNYHESTIDD